MSPWTPYRYKEKEHSEKKKVAACLQAKPFHWSGCSGHREHMSPSECLGSVRGGEGHNWLSLNDLSFLPLKNTGWASLTQFIPADATIPLPINSRIKSPSWNYPVQATQITTFWILTPRESQDKGKSMASVRQNHTEPRDCSISELPPAPWKTRVRGKQRLSTKAPTLAFCQPSALSAWALPVSRHCILSNRLFSPTGS